MRAEDVAPRTWLLAACAGWAVLAWLLALAGLGGRVAPLADDPSLRQPLPQLAASPRERLGPLGQYGEIATRPLFSEDRRPKPFSLRGPEEEGARNTFDYILTSVLLTPRVKLAILQPTAPQAGEGGSAPQPAEAPASIRVKLGESAEEAAGWRLVALEPRQAIFEGPEGQRTLELRAYDGSGGQPATPSTRPVAAAPAAGQAAQRNAATAAANAAANAANSAARQGAKPANAQAIEAPSADPASATPEAQIEAIRKRIQARREQLRREAQQTPAPPPPQAPQVTTQ